jgi:hypothetical protein
MYICAYCRKPCSPNAYQCPHCGDPNPKLIDKPKRQLERKTNTGFMDYETSHDCIVSCTYRDFDQVEEEYRGYERFFTYETYCAVRKCLNDNALNPVHPSKGVFSLGDLANYLQGKLDSPFHD